MAAPAGLRFERVFKSFGQTKAVSGVDLDVRPGEFLVLLGPSGCGKTTLLRLCAGLERLDAGAIFIGERRVDALPPAQRDVAMVFQNYALYPHMSAFENIAFPLRNRGVADAELAQRVHEAAERLELLPLLDRRPAELSGGQQQRVALARAIVRSPAVFLMDEPLSNLDAQLRVQTRGELKRLQRELGTTTLYVTHDQGEAMTLGARVALLRGGGIEQLATPLELYRQPANRFVASFLGSPSINLLAARREDGALVCAGVRIEAPAPEGMEIGVRPEDVVVSPSRSAGSAPARVLVVEPMGNETILTLDASGTRVVARAGPDLVAEPGGEVHVRFATERLLFFDANDGRLLTTTARRG